jgi:ADP-ribose pyrophosphatase YjhB (NUDIX family)
MAAVSTELLVTGVVRSGTDVLLVRRGGPDGPGTAWALPGGRVAQGELAVEALAREMAEETGLTVTGVPRLVCVGQMVNPTAISRDRGEIPPPGGSAVILSYEVRSFHGELDCSADPDAEIAEVAWHPTDRAAALLASHPFPFVRATSRQSLITAAHVGESYFRRSETGQDIALTLDRPAG